MQTPTTFSTYSLLSAFLAVFLTPEIAAQVFVRKPYLQKGSPTSATVCWRVDSDAKLELKYGLSQDKLDKSVVQSTAARDACLTVDKLQPQTRYYYSLQAGAKKLAEGANHYFVTHPPTGSKKKTVIWIIGDSGTGDGNAKAVRDAYVKVNGGNHADVMLMLGDNAYDKGTDGELTGKLFSIYPDIMANTFNWPTIGNHDAGTDKAGPHLAAFNLPTEGESGGVASKSERYFSFDYGNIHFICLDSQTSDRKKDGPQYNWLKQDLQATKSDWIIAYYHHPPYTWGSHNSDKEGAHIEMRQNLQPLMEEYGVDMVFGGHSHIYERSYLLDGAYGDAADNKKNEGKVILNKGSGKADQQGGAYKKKTATGGREGAVYVVAGSSGKVSGKTVPEKHPMVYFEARTLGSVILTIEGNTADAEFIDSKGAKPDYFRMVQETATTYVRGAQESPSTPARFVIAGRKVTFAKGNKRLFYLYRADGTLVLSRAVQGTMELSSRDYPGGEYFYRFGDSFERLVLKP